MRKTKAYLTSVALHIHCIKYVCMMQFVANEEFSMIAKLVGIIIKMENGAIHCT